MSISNNRNHWEAIANETGNPILTPEGLWKGAIEYFKWCDLNPIKAKRTVTTGKGIGTKVEVEFIRPYSLRGMCLHVGVTEEYIRDMRATNKSEIPYLVASRILMNIWVQNTEMAMVGEFNAQFVAKLLNLESYDDTPQRVVIEYVGDLPELSNSESQVLEKLKLENGEPKISD